MSINTDALRDLGLIQENKPKEEDQNQLNQAAFLKLMTTQLRNQNPTKPMDNAEFLGQMAQFSTVSGIQDLNSSIDGLLNNSIENQRLQATNIVGKDVLISSGPFEYLGGKEINGSIDVQSSGQLLEVQVYNSSNSNVRTITVPSASAGEHDFTWDGLDNDGKPVSVDEYRFVAELTRGDDVSVANVEVFDTVESIVFNNTGDIKLNLAHQGTIDFDRVSQVR